LKHRLNKYLLVACGFLLLGLGHLWGNPDLHTSRPHLFSAEQNSLTSHVVSENHPELNKFHLIAEVVPQENEEESRYGKSSVPDFSQKFLHDSATRGFDFVYEATLPLFPLVASTAVSPGRIYILNQVFRL